MSTPGPGLRGQVTSSGGRGRPRPQIAAWEGVALASCLCWPTAVLYLPSVVAALGREDGWLGMLLGGVVVVPLGLLLGALAARCPRAGFVEQAVAALGPVAGRVAGGFFTLGCALLAVYAVRAGAEMVGLLMLPRTPRWVVAAVVVMQGLVGAWYGLEVVARAAVLAFLSVGIVLALLIPGFVPLFDARRLLPVLAGGPAPLLSSAAVSAGFWGQVVLLGLSADAFRSPRVLRATVLGGGLSSLAVGWLLMVLAQGAAGWFGVSRFAMPAVEVIRSVRVLLPLLERIDVAVVMAWTLMGFVQIAWLLWACARGAARAIGLADSRPLLPPASAVVLGISLAVPEDLLSMLLVWTRVTVPLTTLGLAVLVAAVWLAAAPRGPAGTAAAPRAGR